jgi:hypothetical protein
MERNRRSLRWTLAMVVATSVLLVPIVANAAVSRFVNVPDSNVFGDDSLRTGGRSDALRPPGSNVAIGGLVAGREHSYITCRSAIGPGSMTWRIGLLPVTRGQCRA